MGNREYLNEIIYNMEKKVLGLTTPEELRPGEVYRVFLIDHIMKDDVVEKELTYTKSTRHYGGSTYLSDYSIFKETGRNKYKHKLLNDNYKLTWYCVRKGIS